ncbi:MAG: acyl-CoA thioesterase [Niabella sp.]
MPRIKIVLPETFSFTTSISVRITDVNYGGHVGNDAILSLLHEARMQFLAKYGYSEMNMGGSGLIMADVAIEFKQEAFYGDDLKISVTASDFGRVNFDIFYKVEKEVEGKKILVAVAKTGMLCYDYALKKLTRVPEEVFSKLT